FARSSFAKRKWIIRAQRDTFCAEELAQQCQCFGVVDERIDVELCGASVISQIFSRICVVLHRDQIRPHMKCLFDPADGERECAAAMSESNTQFREPLEHSSKNHRTNGE